MISKIAKLMLLLFAIGVLGADDITQTSKQLQDVKKDISEVKKQKTTVTKQKKNVQKDLSVINKQLSEKERELRKYELNLAESESQLSKLNKDLKAAQNRLDQTQFLLNKRARAMYKLGYAGKRFSYLKLMLGNESISDINNQYKYMSAIATLDRELLDKAIAEKAELDYHKRLVEEKKNQIISYKTETEKIRKEILQKKSERQVLLTQVTKEEKKLSSKLSGLQKSAAQLERLIARLQAQSKKSQNKNSPNRDWSEKIVSNFDSKSGRLPWPVSGTIIENASPSMDGVSIKANQGTDIRSVDDGIVDYARFFDGVGYGQMVIVNHGNGYRTLYAHASSILVKEGQKVSKGQVIAKVGDTGSNRGPLLYFEVWKGARPMPTRQWLMSK